MRDEKRKLSISLRNSKMGAIPSVSLPPIITCRPNAPCRRKCYAVKTCRYSPQAKAAYERNLALWQSEPAQYFIELWMWLLLNSSTKLFRWHVAGDIPNQDYLEGMKETARRFPGVDFLAFTKKYELDFGALPSNLSVVMSCWPGLPLPDNGLPRSYFLDLKDPDQRIPEMAIHCPGNCIKCRRCWYLADIGGAIVFTAH